MQVEQDLRRHITSGAIDADARLPRETELATLYGVSRMTVRRSLEGLERGGFVRRVHGVGTIVVPPTTSVTVDLSSAAGTLSLEWFNPTTGTVVSGGTTTGGAARTFTAPSGSTVLYLR